MNEPALDSNTQIKVRNNVDCAPDETMFMTLKTKQNPMVHCLGVQMLVENHL